MDVTFRDYGGGLVEFGYSSRDTYCGDCPDPDRIRRFYSPEQIAERNARRARTVIRRRIMSLGLDHLLTLTYKGNIEDFRVSVSNLRRFIRLVRKKYPGYRWVAVPEIQEKRAERTGFEVWHWHLAVKGFQDVRYLREVWRSVVGEGNIDVRGPSGKSRCGKLNLAYYLVKYISKKVEAVNSGLHRYFGTRDVGDVDIVKIIVDRPSTCLVWISEVLAQQGQAVRQTVDTAFGGWGATWETVKGVRFGKISSCTV